jgi:gamma-glutamyl phosphate reductase
MNNAVEILEAKAKEAKTASHRMAFLSTEVKNKALHNISSDLISRKEEILAENKLDYQEAESMV